MHVYIDRQMKHIYTQLNKYFTREMEWGREKMGGETGRSGRRGNSGQAVKQTNKQIFQQQTHLKRDHRHFQLSQHQIKYLRIKLKKALTKNFMLMNVAILIGMGKIRFQSDNI